MFNFNFVYIFLFLIVIVCVDVHLGKISKSLDDINKTLNKKG